MPAFDSSAAARLIGYADEILALVGGWPKRWRSSGAISHVPVVGVPPLREINDERLAEFDGLDAKIAGLQNLLGIPLPTNYYMVNRWERVHGYTELVLFDRWACNVDGWQRRLLSLKQAVQEIAVVARGQSVPEKRKRGRQSNPERDDSILAAVESGQYSTHEAVGKAFGLSRTGVSKAADRARKRRK